MASVVSAKATLSGEGNAVASLMDRVAASRLGSIAAILIVALCCTLPGFAATSPLDRDEAGLAVAARAMVASGDWTEVRTVIEPRFVEPVGAIWLEAAVATVVGVDHTPIWVYRIPALIGALAAAVGTWWMALAFGRPRAALIAGLFVAANIVVAVEARVGRADAPMLAAVVFAEGALARLWLQAGRPNGRGIASGFWAATALGTLLAGPIAAGVVALTVVALTVAGKDRGWLKRLGLVWGLPLILVVMLVPLVLITRDTAGADPDMLLRMGGAASPEAPPGSYTLLFFALFWPGASFFVIAIPWLVEQLRRPAVVFALSASLPLWIVAELIPEKLPHYVLPAFPAIALIAGLAVDEGAARVTGRPSWFYSLGPVLVAILLAVGAPLLAYFLEGQVPYVALPFLVAGVVLGAVAWLRLRKGEQVASAALSAGAAVVLYAGVFGFVLPELDHLRLSSRILQAAARAGSCAPVEYAASGFVEPSLVFLAPAEPRFLDAASTADFLAKDGCRIAIVEAGQISSFRQRAEDLGVEVTAIGRASGFDLGNGRWAVLRAFAVDEEGEGQVGHRR